MNTGDGEMSSEINGRPRSFVFPPPTKKSSRKVDSKPSQEESKRVSTSSNNPLSNSDDFSKKSLCSSVLECLCPYCDKTFFSKQTASKHVRRFHFPSSKEDTIINCLYCNHTGTEQNDIFKHMIDSHPNQYFACLDCNTRFPSTKELAEHKLNICDRQKLQYRSKLRSKSMKSNKKSNKLDRQVVIREQERHGYNSIVISCELKPTHVTDTADIEDNITTNLILPSSKGNKVIDKNAVILLDDLQWNKRIPHNFSFHNTDTDQILSRLGVVHRSPRTGESTRKDLFKTIDDATQKFERCFDTNFYSKVASNVHENLSKFLDGSFNFNPDPNHTIKPRKAKNSVPINTVEGFPILLSCEQYSRNLFDGYMPRAIAPKHKWKWDNLENDRNTFNADQMKRDSHMNNCIVTLVSSLDIWTQLCMRQKFEDKFKITPFEKKTEKKKIISNELKEILESRQLPASKAQVSRSNCSGLVKIREDLNFPTLLGLAPTTTKYAIQPAVLSGEWVRPRCYVCCACGAQTRDPRALSAHISTQHPNAQVQHYEIPGELFLNVDILKHLYVPPSPVPNRTRPPRGFRECTKCNISVTIEDLHQHMLDCAGDMPTVRRKCRYRHFGVRKRRTRIQDNRMRKKMRKDIHRQNGRPRTKIRTDVGDAETIRKMLADLPAKRHRVIITPISATLRSKKKMIKQLGQISLKKRLNDETKVRKISTVNNSQSGDLLENTESYLKVTPSVSNNKLIKNKFQHRSAIVDNKVLKNSYRKSRQEFVGTKLGTQPVANPTTFPQNVNIQVLSTENISSRINVNSSSFNTREQTNRSNNDGSNNRENQNPDRNDDNGNFHDQGAPPQNVPLKHSIARLTADSDMQDKAVQFHHLFLVQQECNNVTQHVPSGQPVLFENKTVAVKFDKPPLDISQRSVTLDTQTSQKNKTNKHRKGLNDCIAMLKHKLFKTVKAPDVSIQCKIGETSSSKHELKTTIKNCNDITVQCPDDNHSTDIFITPRYINSINKDNVMEEPVNYASLQCENTKHISGLVPTHNKDLNIDININLSNNDAALISTKEVPEYNDVNRNDFTVQNNINLPDAVNYQSKGENIKKIIKTITNTDVVHQDIDYLLSTTKKQEVKNSEEERDKEIRSIDNKLQFVVSQKQTQGKTTEHGLETNQREKAVYREQNETQKKTYRSGGIPLAHCSFRIEIPSPLDLSGKCFVNEVTAHCSKQDLSRNVTDDPYETLDLSNKGIKNHTQEQATIASSEVVVDLRVKQTFCTHSEDKSVELEDNTITPTDLSVKHTSLIFTPTDLSLKKHTTPIYFNDSTHKHVNVNNIRSRSNLSSFHNDTACLNLSSNDFPTDLSQTSLKIISTIENSSREINNYKHIYNNKHNKTYNNYKPSVPILESDLTGDDSVELSHNSHVITSGKNSVQYCSSEVHKESTSLDVIISMEEEEIPNVKTTKQRFTENVEIQPMNVVDKVPINLSKSNKESFKDDILHRQVQLNALTPLQSHGSKIIDNLQAPSMIPQPSINIAQSSCNKAEFESSTPVEDYQSSKSRWPQENQKDLNYKIPTEITINTSTIDHDPEIAKKIALLPKELVEILGNMPVDHRNQLLSVLPQYVFKSAPAVPDDHDASDSTKLSSPQRKEKETDISQMPTYSHSGLSNSQYNEVDMYQIQQLLPNSQQSQGKTKSPPNTVQFSNSLEAIPERLSAGYISRDSIDSSVCNFIDLTDESIDIKSLVMTPESQYKNECLAIQSVKTNNDKTASLRAVRIKAPSERAKTSKFISESQCKNFYPENSNIFKQNSSYYNEAVLIQQNKISTIKETMVANINSTDIVVSPDCDLNKPQMMSSSDPVSENRENATIISTSAIIDSDILNNNPVIEITSNQESFDRNKIKKVESNMSLEPFSPESRLSCSLTEKTNENIYEDDSEDDITLAVIVKQKQREQSYRTRPLPNNYVNIETQENDEHVGTGCDNNTLVSKNLTSAPLDDHALSTLSFCLQNQINNSNDIELEYEQLKNMNEKLISQVLEKDNAIADKTDIQLNIKPMSPRKSLLLKKRGSILKINQNMQSENEITESVDCLEKESLTTRFRRVRRKKSFSVEGNDVDCDSNVSLEQRGPLTKKQLIFSKLQQDGEISVMKNVDCTRVNEQNCHESELDCETLDLILDIFKKENKANSSEAVKNKQKKTKLTKEDKTEKEKSTSITPLEDCKIQKSVYDETLACDDISLKISTEGNTVLHDKQNVFINGKQTQNICSKELNMFNENCSTLVNSDTSINIDKHVKKQTDRRCCSRSAVTYVPYNIQTLDTESEEMDTNHQNEIVNPKNITNNRQIPEVNSASSTLEKCTEESIDENQTNQNLETGQIAKTKDFKDTKNNYDENKLNCDIVSKITQNVVHISETVSEITGKRNSNNDMIEEAPIHKIKKSKTTVAKKMSNNANSNDKGNDLEYVENACKNIKQKRIQKRTERRCRSRSVLVKSISKTYDPYDIALLDADVEPFIKRKHNKSSVKKTINFNNDDIIQSIEIKTPSTNTLNNCEDEYIQNKNVSFVSEDKMIQNNTNESSLNDETWKKIEQENEKNNSVNSEIEKCQSLSKNNTKTLSVTSEKIETVQCDDVIENSDSGNEIDIQFLLNFFKKTKKEKDSGTKKKQEKKKVINKKSVFNPEYEKEMNNKDDIRSNSPSTSITIIGTDKIQNKQESKGLFTNMSKTKEHLSDSDESSKSDEPLKKYVKQNGKKKSDDCKTSRKRSKKISSVVSEKIDIEAADNIHNDNEERMRSEQFMESFGFFSERKPRKSNLLATKKITETINLINSTYEPEDNSVKKSVKKEEHIHCENRKDTDDEGNLKESLIIPSKKASKRGRKKKISTKIKPYCEVCRKEFRRPDNFLRHQMSLAHVTRVCEVELKVKNVSSSDENNYLVLYKEQLDRLRILQDKINRRKKYCKSLENLTLPTLEDVIADVTRTVRQQQLAHRGLSRDEALFLDCCELLNSSHNDDQSGRAKDSTNCKINCYTCAQASSECLNILEKRINDLETKCEDGDVDSITAQDIMESEEVRNLENDFITGLKEAASSGNNFNSSPFNSTSKVPDDTKVANTIKRSKDIKMINEPDETEVKKVLEVKEKMYPDVIGNIDMFEDKFDKIKRKCRSQAAKQTRYVETISCKSRKKVEKKKRIKSPKQNNSHGAVPTKGALKGFEGVKVSILTSEINMASILASSSKKKKRSNSKRKKDRKHPESYKCKSDEKCKDPHKKFDVYEFKDNDDAEVLDLRPSTLMERFKNIRNKAIPSTSKLQPINIDPEMSVESTSDGDDFVYMSDDYICSEAETESSLFTCDLENLKASSEMKKPLTASKIKDIDKTEKTEKNAVMGKIFKNNAVRTDKKIEKANDSEKPKANLDQLFDSLLEPSHSKVTKSTLPPTNENKYKLDSTNSRKSANNRSKQNKETLKNDEHDNLDHRYREEPSSPEIKFCSPISYTRQISPLTSTSKKNFSFDEDGEYKQIRRNFATSREDEDKFSFDRSIDVMSLATEDSLLRYPSDISDKLSNKRKTKEKEFKNQSTISDFDYNDEILDNTGVARQRARRKCTVGKQNILTETWSSESEPDGVTKRPNSSDSVQGLGRKKKSRKKDGHTLGGRKSNNRQNLSKCEVSGSGSGTPSSRSASEILLRVYPSRRPSTVYSNFKGRRRRITYYWSEEEETKHVQQHGWIVGDSHKKLVTMLAHAKGKRNNDGQWRHCYE